MDLQHVVVETLDADEPIGEAMIGMLIILQDEISNRQRDNTSATDELINNPDATAREWHPAGALAPETAVRRTRFNLFRWVRAVCKWWVYDRR